jgi:hypothetical protein
MQHVKEMAASRVPHHPYRTSSTSPENGPLQHGPNGKQNPIQYFGGSSSVCLAGKPALAMRPSGSSETPPLMHRLLVKARGQRGVRGYAGPGASIENGASRIFAYLTADEPQELR